MGGLASLAAGAAGAVGWAVAIISNFFFFFKKTQVFESENLTLPKGLFQRKVFFSSKIRNAKNLLVKIVSLPLACYEKPKTCCPMGNKRSPSPALLTWPSLI
jgi:hypothetical protein